MCRLGTPDTGPSRVFDNCDRRSVRLRRFCAAPGWPAEDGLGECAVAAVSVGLATLEPMSLVGQRDDDATWPYGPVVFGCGNFGGIGGARDFLGKGMSEETSLTSMDEAVELGIAVFDTAERYAAGESERIVGRWLESRPSSVTQQVRISTKVGPPWVDGRDGRFDSDYIVPLFSGSLERLGLEAVEVLYTHAPDDHPDRPSTYDPAPIEATLEALESLRADGRVRRLGASNINAEQLRSAIDAAERMGVAGYEVIQNGYNLLDPDGDAAVRQLASECGLAYTAYSALGSGVLTGKYRRDEAPPAGSLVEIGYLDPVTPALHDALDQLHAAAVGRGTTTGALALAWLIAHPGVAALTTAPSRTSPHLALVDAALRIRVSADEAAIWSAWFFDAAADNDSSP
jgi:aryl-alcohol dehydrogenase-like predicted oxidoreductase